MKLSVLPLSIKAIPLLPPIVTTNVNVAAEEVPCVACEEISRSYGGCCWGGSVTTACSKI
jgi:hypothetical protein